jgi:nickel-dependent lactate racemase
MKTYALPYGENNIQLNVDEAHVNKVLRSNLANYRTLLSGKDLVKNALEHPIGQKKLSELAKEKKNIVIISSDHTRPVPSKIIMPLILKEIREGNPEAKITILIATGLHRSTTINELRSKFGNDIVNHEKIIIHDCDDSDNMAYLGKLPSGGDLVINKLATDADLLVAEGFIEPHFFAGFSGGRKSILPGIASRETVMYNHNSKFISSPLARTGNLKNNPIHQDMIYAARKAGLAFIINVVLNAKHDPIYAVAGDVEKAHKKGCDFLLSQCRIKAETTDIVITTNGGYPLDQNIYQAVKGMTAAESLVKSNGVIIMASESRDGDGGKSFHDIFRKANDLHELMNTFLGRKPEETVPDQWQAQIFARILMKAKIIYISKCDDQTIRDMHMIPAHNMNEALDIAIKIINKADYTINIIEDGVSVIAEETNQRSCY